MHKIPLLPADTYIVSNKTVLHEEDRKLLIMLYQPIIGSTAINLYFTLWSYLDKCEILSCTWTHHHLMTSMQLKLEDILEARQKLEGMGLIKTYFKEGTVRNYLYELYSPISSYEFLDNPILSTSLYHNIGATEYEKIIEYFRLPTLNLKEYEDITSLFQEIFMPSNVVTLEHSDIKRVQKLGISFEPSINFDNCLSYIPEEMLNYRSITKDIKDLIYKLAFIYNYNDETMSEIIRNSLTEKKTIDKKKLRDYSNKVYRFENSGKIPSIIYQNQPEYLRKPAGDTSLKSKMIYTFETTSPHDFLVNKNKGAKLSTNDIAILEYLLLEQDMNPGVVNVLLDFVLKINDNKLTKGFIEAIASQWKRSDIQTVTEAMELAEKEHKKRNTPVFKKAKEKTVIEKPSWFDQKIEAEEASEEEKQAFLNRIQHIK